MEKFPTKGNVHDLSEHFGIKKWMAQRKREAEAMSIPELDASTIVSKLQAAAINQTTEWMVRHGKSVLGVDPRDAENFHQAANEFAHRILTQAAEELPEKMRGLGEVIKPRE